MQQSINLSIRALLLDAFQTFLYVYCVTLHIYKTIFLKTSLIEVSDICIVTIDKNLLIVSLSEDLPNIKLLCYGKVINFRPNFLFHNVRLQRNALCSSLNYKIYEM